MRYLICTILGFIFLDLYVNLIPQLFNLNTVMWLLYAAVFFPIAHTTSKVTGLNGLNTLGVKFHNGWNRILTLGFILGFMFWLAMELISFSLNGFSIVGVKTFGVGSFFMLQAFLGLFLGSFMNDIIVRGYVFAHLKNKVNNVSLVLITAFIYALDDSWIEGIGLHNTIFSVVLGLSLGYVFLKSGSIWVTTGLHWGSNIVYCIFYGIPGRESDKGLLLIERHYVNSILLDNLSIIVSIVMFIFIIIFYNRLKINSESRL